MPINASGGSCWCRISSFHPSIHPSFLIIYIYICVCMSICLHFVSPSWQTKNLQFRPSPSATLIEFFFFFLLLHHHLSSFFFFKEPPLNKFIELFLGPDENGILCLPNKFFNVLNLCSSAYRREGQGNEQIRGLRCCWKCVLRDLHLLLRTGFVLFFLPHSC